MNFKQKNIGKFLACSGTFFAFVAWSLLIFWPGYFFWIGWISIARGRDTFRRRWFWISSAVWNLGVLAFLGALTEGAFPKGWDIGVFQFYFALMHSLVASGLSVFGAILASRKEIDDEN